MRSLSWKNTVITLVVVLLFGVGLRAYGLGNNSFVADEFLDMNAAYGYFQTGQWQAWDFNTGKPSVINRNEARDERAFIYKWQVAQLFRFLPPTEATARMVSVLWGAVSVLVIFWSTFVFTRRKEIGLVAAFLFAVSVSGIVFDRRLRMYAMFFPLYLGLATVLYQFLESEYRGRFVWLQRVREWTGLNVFFTPFVLVLGILSFLTHQLSAVIVFSTALYLIVRAVQVYRESKSWKNKYVALLALGALGMSGFAILTPGFVASFTAGLIFFDDHYSYFGYVFADFAHPLLAASLMVCGAYWLGVRKKNVRVAWWLTLSFLVPLALAIWFFRRNAGPQYIFFAQSFGLILVAVGMYRVVDILEGKFPEWGKKGVVGGMVALLLLVPHYGYFFEENNTYHETASGGNPNYRKVFTSFKKEKLPTDALITRNFRNYYFSGADVPVYDLGDEIDRKRMTIDDFLSIRTAHLTGWVILSDNDMNDYITKDLKTYFDKHLERVSNENVRGAIFAYRWKESPDTSQ